MTRTVWNARSGTKLIRSESEIADISQQLRQLEDAVGAGSFQRTRQKIDANLKLF